MAFPTSSRFAEYSPCSPSPTAYNIPSAFNDCVPATRLKPCPFGNHKCGGKCSSACPNFKNAVPLKESTSSKRYSLHPNYVKMDNSNNKSNESNQEKILHPAKRRLSLQSSENKENTMNPQRKSLSNIPRFKKNVTEGQAPSFMSRARNIHYCFPPINEDDPLPLGNFNRHSVKRKSIKPMKKAHEERLEESKLSKKRPFNKSYTILPSMEASTKVAKLNATIDTISTTVQGAIPKQPDDNNMIKHNLDLQNSPYYSKLLKKDSQLARQLSTNKKYYEIAYNVEPADENGKMRPHDVLALSDCNMILVSEEFIDDDYDSYIKGLTESKGYLQVLQNKELYEMTKYLVRVYLEENKTEASSTPVQKESGAKLDKSMRKKIGKFFSKRKKSNVVSNRDVWREIEAVVRSAIDELKGEFQMNIYEKTNEKLDQLVSELRSVVLKANKNIEDVCESKAVNLISRLENIALKAINP